MTAIAEQLDKKLKTLDPKAALSLEKLVRDAMELADSRRGAGQGDRLPSDFFTRIAEESGNDPIERPPQGEFEKRPEW